MFEKAEYIVIEGPIGAGKTSLARRLATRMHCDMLLEQPELNPFLNRFYHEPQRWNLATQLSFLFARFDRLAELPPRGKRVVSDFLLAKDALFAELNLEPDELALYRRIFATHSAAQPRAPDLVIYLQAKPETLVSRLQARGNPSDRRISKHYLERVIEYYARFFYAYEDVPVFTVDADVLNPIGEDDDFELLMQRLQGMRGFREYFGYA